MERYRREPGVLDASMVLLRHASEDDDDEVVHEQVFEGYKVFDLQSGNTEDAWVAFSRDPDVAERITRLLNAEETARREYELEKVGVE